VIEHRTLQTRHLRMHVAEQGAGPLVLLTAFGATEKIESNENVHRGKLGDVSWTAIVGGGSADGLESDAHLAVAVRGPGDAVEAMRFGGTKLVCQGVSVPSTAQDVFATIAGGQATRVVETLK